MDSVERFAGLGVTVLRETAKFTGLNTVAAGSRIVRARRFVIATGSTPLTPAIPGLESVRTLTSDTIFDLDVLPAHLVIIGAGPIGLELAQAFRRLGSAVTVLEAGRALPREDEELAGAVIERLEREGVTLRAGVAISRAEPLEGGRFRLALGADGTREWIEGSHLLLAVGRRPRVENLGLERANVAFSDKGIRVRADMRTTNRRIFAIGDVTGGPQFTHAGNHQAALVLRKILFRLPARFVATDLPRVTYTEPELAWTGLDETQARARHKSLRVMRAAFNEVDRAATDGTTGGHIKVIATPRGRVLGAGIVGAHAGELLTPWTLAVEGRLTIRDIASTIVPYPTLSEISRKAAIGFYTDALDRPILQTIMRWLRRLG
jgi:pyruvate/2-oxoglutarate dehydrogenase complex dihydrolipoamide dehydrogenase (E3) component